MKLQLFTAVLAALISVTVLAKEGGREGGGGFIVDEKGVPVPADVYFKQRDYKMPDYYVEQIKPADHPKLFGQLELMRLSLEARSEGGKVILPASDFQFWRVKKLSYTDTLTVEDGYTAKQVAYTFSFNRLSEDLSTATTTRIIEILEGSEFWQLSPETKRDQALILAHEQLHHTSFEVGGVADHHLISPLIKNLRTVLVAHDRQAAGDWSALTAEEKDASVKFQNILNLFKSGIRFGQEEKECSFNKKVSCTLEMTPHGGVLEIPSEFAEKSGRMKQNYVGITSWIGVTAVGEKPNDDYSKKWALAPNFQGNTFLTSRLVLSSNYTKSPQKMKPCTENTFVRVRGVKVVCKGGRTGNLFSNVQGRNRILNLKSDSFWSNPPWFIAESLIHFNGNNNKIEDVKLSAALLLGEGNVVSNVVVGDPLDKDVTKLWEYVGVSDMADNQDLSLNLNNHVTNSTISGMLGNGVTFENSNIRNVWAYYSHRISDMQILGVRSGLIQFHKVQDVSGLRFMVGRRSSLYFEAKTPLRFDPDKTYDYSKEDIYAKVVSVEEFDKKYGK